MVYRSVHVQIQRCRKVWLRCAYAPISVTILRRMRARLPCIRSRESRWHHVASVCLLSILSLFLSFSPFLFVLSVSFRSRFLFSLFSCSPLSPLFASFLFASSMGAECGFLLRVHVVDLQQHLGVRVVRWAKVVVTACDGDKQHTVMRTGRFFLFNVNCQRKKI